AGAQGGRRRATPAPRSDGAQPVRPRAGLRAAALLAGGDEGAARRHREQPRLLRLRSRRRSSAGGPLSNPGAAAARRAARLHRRVRPLRSQAGRQPVRAGHRRHAGADRPAGRWPPAVLIAPMPRALSSLLRPSPFTGAILATVLLATLLPAKGDAARA